MGNETSKALEDFKSDLIVYASPPIVLEALKLGEKLNDERGTLDPFIQMLRCSLLCSAEGLRSYGGVLALMGAVLTESTGKDLDRLCAAIIRAIKPFVKKSPFFETALGAAAMNIEQSGQVMRKLAKGERVGQAETSVNITISPKE